MGEGRERHPMDGMRIRARRKNERKLPFSEPQGGPAREATSLERQRRVLDAMKDFYRGRRK